MAFDPLKYGAIPVNQGSPAQGGFDPSKYGAIPVNQAPQQPSLADSIWHSLAVPGQAIGDSLVKAGTNVANLATGGIKKFNEGLPENTIDVPKLAGDYVNAGLTVAAPGIGAGGGLAARVGANAAAGAASGAAQGIVNGDSAGKVIGGALEQGAIGGALGALGGTAATVDKVTSPAYKAAKEATKATKAVQTSIDAVNPELKGRNAIQAYKDIVTGKRVAQKANIFSLQSVTPTEDVKQLGTRLSDIIKSSDPLKNLHALGQDLNKTEAQLHTALVGDPELNFNADKIGLMERLNAAKTKVPGEYGVIRDSRAVYDHVFDYAKEVATKAEDTITGLRDARSIFDAQSKLEYPSAFKDGGYIDIKTPAGRAIKEARDVFNDHLYETAPNGSEIQKLIGREADIFKASDFIGPKAVKTHGLNSLSKVQKYFKEHPLVAGAAGVIGTGAAVIGGAKAVNASGN